MSSTNSTQHALPSPTLATRLDPSILLDIFENVAGDGIWFKRDNRAWPLCLLCKVWAAPAHVVLYRRITFEPGPGEVPEDSSGEPRSVQGRLVRRIEEDKELASGVKELQAGCVRNSPQSRRLFQRLLRALPHLHTLIGPISRPDISDMDDYFSDMLRGPEQPFSWPMIKRLEITGSDLSYLCPRPSAPPPSVVELKIRDEIKDSDFGSTGFDKFASSVKTTLTVLDLDLGPLSTLMVSPTVTLEPYRALSSLSIRIDPLPSSPYISRDEESRAKLSCEFLHRKAQRIFETVTCLPALKRLLLDLPDGDAGRPSASKVVEQRRELLDSIPRLLTVLVLRLVLPLSELQGVLESFPHLKHLDVTDVREDEQWDRVLDEGKKKELKQAARERGVELRWI